MAKQNSSYAVILRDDGLEFPGVVGDAVGNPLVLDERNIVSINTYEDGVTITLVGGVDVDVSHDLIVYDGRRKSPSSRYGAKDDEAFFAMLEIIGGRSETDAHVWGECMNELELAVLLAETVRTDNRVDVDVSSLIRRLFWTEVAVERRLSDEKGNSPLFGQISRLQQSDVIVEKAKESYELGCCYRDGTDGLQDDSLAKVFFEISAMAGNADAQNCLGARYHEGKGVEKNLDLAFTWYMEAAKQGHEKALYNLGLCFENGWGCEPDIETAKQCYAESAGKGYGLAKTALNRLIPNKPQITGTMSTPANSKIDWGSLVATGAVVLGGAAIAAIDAFMNRKKS